MRVPAFWLPTINLIILGGLMITLWYLWRSQPAPASSPPEVFQQALVDPPQPCSCPQITDPVCTQGFITYRNACEATCQQAQILYAGICKVADSSEMVPAECQLCSLECDGERLEFIDETGCPSCTCSQPAEDALDL